MKFIREFRLKFKYYIIHIYYMLHIISHRKNDDERKIKIVVALTSYPIRLSTVHLTIESILCQSVKPDFVVLYLGDDCKGVALTKKLQRLQKYGLIIKYKKGNLKPHKKYFYAFREYINDLVITVDDDALYEKHLVKLLYESYCRFPNAVSAKRVHRICYDENGKIKPYKDWEGECTNILQPSMDLLAVGGGGVLYVPKLFGDELFDEDVILKYALTADDLWLKIHEWIYGIPVVFVPGKNINPTPICGVFDGENALYRQNALLGNNDIVLKKLLSLYNNKIKGISVNE